MYLPTYLLVFIIPVDVAKDCQIKSNLYTRVESQHVVSFQALIYNGAAKCRRRLTAFAAALYAARAGLRIKIAHTRMIYCFMLYYACTNDFILGNNGDTVNF